MLLLMKEKHLVALYLSDRPELFYPACMVCQLFKGLQKYLRTGKKTYYSVLLCIKILYSMKVFNASV